MKALYILKRCLEGKKDLARIDAMIQQRRELLDDISAPQADPNGGGRGSTDPDKAGRILADIDQLERKRKAREEELEAEQVSGLSLLDMIPETENSILYQYYLRGVNTGAIARKKKYTTGYVRKKKRDGEMLLDMLSPERVAGTLPLWYLKERGEEK